MKRRAFIVHGWEFTPEMHWYPWLKKELERKGFEVIALAMPQTEHPDIKRWVGHLKKQVGIVDKNTYFVGHSIGCQAIIRFLASQKNKMGGAVFVGGWFALTQKATPTAEYRKIAKPWLLNPIDFDAARRSGRFVAILSADDPYVPLVNGEVFEKTLNAKVIVEKGKGHYTEEEGIVKVPRVVKELEELRGKR
jgi:uncharacterized protein